MNNLKSLTRVVALMLLVVMTMSMVSCDLNSLLESVMGHTHKFVDGECACGETDPDYTHEHTYANGVCIYCGEAKPEDKPSDENKPGDENKPDDGDKTEYKTITIAEALEIAAQYPDGAPELYYIHATVKSMVKAGYGEMYITDGTNEILVYNTKNADGTVGYADMSERPVKGDEVLLFCTLNNHNGTNQVKSAWIVEFKHVEAEIDLTKYTQATLAEARDAAADSLLKVNGVVAQITYANGKKPQGVILVDSTSSIYVYDPDLAGQVKIGNTVEIAGTKAYYVLGTEQANADKFG